MTEKLRLESLDDVLREAKEAQQAQRAQRVREVEGRREFCNLNELEETVRAFLPFCETRQYLRRDGMLELTVWIGNEDPSQRLLAGLSEIMRGPSIWTDAHFDPPTCAAREMVAVDANRVVIVVKPTKETRVTFAITKPQALTAAMTSPTKEVDPTLRENIVKSYGTPYHEGPSWLDDPIEIAEIQAHLEKLVTEQAQDEPEPARTLFGLEPRGDYHYENLYEFMVRRYDSESFGSGAIPEEPPSKELDRVRAWHETHVPPTAPPVRSAEVIMMDLAPHVECQKAHPEYGDLVKQACDIHQKEVRVRDAFIAAMERIQNCECGANGKVGSAMGWTCSSWCPSNGDNNDQ